VEELGNDKTIEAGIPKLRIEEAAARKQARIDSGQDIIVGVNKYRLEKKILSHSRCGQPNGSQTTIRTDRIKASRDTEKTGTTAKLIDCAKTGRKLTRNSRRPARNRTTLGEISDALETVLEDTKHKLNL
jgi:methylmalonyl-CoA mutase